MFSDNNERALKINVKLVENIVTDYCTLFNQEYNEAIKMYNEIFEESIGKRRMESVIRNSDLFSILRSLQRDMIKRLHGLPDTGPRDSDL
jgi:hypothetical protein